MADLPEEMVETIQSYMPAKSLIRFKSVCRPWQTRIEDPHFIKIHSHNFSRPPKTSSVESHLITHPAFDSMLDFFSEHEPHNTIYIYLSSCKGMVALFYMNESFSAQEIVLWNPAIKQSKCLPHSAAAPRGQARIVSLGFGRDARDDFKVVRVFCLDEERLEAEVYSSVEDSWSAVDHAPRFDEFTVRGLNHDVIVEGNPYWIASTKNQWLVHVAEEGESSSTAGEIDGTVIDDNHVLLGFNMTERSFMITPLPKKWSKMFLVDWNGAVGMVGCVKREDDWLESLDVWVYGDEKQQWIRRVSFGAVLDLQVDKCLAYCSFSGKIVVGCKDGKVFIYDSKNHSASVTQLKNEGVELEHSFWVTAYEENMVSVEGMAAAEERESGQELHGAINPIYGFIVTTVNSSGEIACYYRLASDDFAPPQHNFLLRCWANLITFICG